MQNQNQFSQTAEKGMMDMRFNNNVIACRIDSAFVGETDVAVAVKLVDNSSDIPTVTPVVADTDDVFGFIKMNYIRNKFKAGDTVDIACFHDNIMYMESSAAIARGADVMVVVTGTLVATAAGAGKTIVGEAFDKATAANQLIRVRIDLKSSKTVVP